MKQLIISTLIFISYLNFPTAFAYYPLITDDAATIGRRKFQYELNLEYGYESNLHSEANQSSIINTLTLGIFDNLDFSVALPFVYMKEKKIQNNEVYGFSDIEVYLKYRLYEKNGLKIGLKPIATIPTGDENQGLGKGLITGQIFILVDIDLSKYSTMYFNIGYLRNENNLEEKKNLLHFSVAGDLEVVKNFYFVANIGATSNTDKDNEEMPIFFLVGICYLLSDDFDISFALKTGLTEPEMDLNLLSGISFRF